MPALKMSLSEALEDISKNDARNFSKLSEFDQVDIHLAWEQSLERRALAKRAAAWLGVAALAASTVWLFLTLRQDAASSNLWMVACAPALACTMSGLSLWTSPRYKARTRDQLLRSYAMSERYRLGATLH